MGKIRGSSAIAGAVWGTWQLEHIPKQDPNNKKKLIIDPKDPKRILSVFVKDTEGQQLQLELDLENNSWINHDNVGDSFEWEIERKTLQARIIDVLTRNGHKPGLSGRYIIELLQLTPEEGRSIYTTLNRMVTKRLINCHPAPGDRHYNLYSLPKQPPPDDSIPSIKISVSTWARVLGTRGSSISLKNDCICSVIAVALAILKALYLLVCTRGDLNPDAIRLSPI